MRNSALQGCSVRKAHFRFFWNFQNFRTPFPFLSTLRMYLFCSRATLIKENFTTYFFLIIFQSFRCSYFKRPLLNHLWWSLAFGRVLDCTPQSRLILKNDSTRDNFSKFSDMNSSPLKNLWSIPILVATGNICKNRLIHIRCPSGYFEKHYVQSTKLWSSILVKKTL